MSEVSPEEPVLDSGVFRIVQERYRQQHDKGYDPSHDEGYVESELLNAAMEYLRRGSYHAQLPDAPAVALDEGWTERYWPWDDESFKPTNDPIRNLEKAGALVAAEIDRLLLKRSKGE